ncbi:MAG: TRAP transporter large permease subunit [Oleiphilaceae bacterium]|nr:TRAP transporter large permease subunit [Oleiphilaceae bacterium]
MTGLRWTVPRRSSREWFSSLPVCLILLAVLLFNTSTDVHNRLLQLGEALWPGYHQLRSDPQPPQCDLMVDIDEQVERLARRRQQQQGDVTDLLGESEPDREALQRSVEASLLACEARHLEYQDRQSRITVPLRLYRSVEQGFSDLTLLGLGAQRPLLILLVMVCAITATLGRHHIAMRGIESRLDYRVSYSAQLVANLMLLGSNWLFRESAHATIVAVSPVREAVHLLWVLCFALLSLASLWRLVRLPDGLPAGGGWLHALMSIPLYAIMCLIAGSYFIAQDYAQGVAVYLGALMEHSEIFINVALYVWAGMMLKQTRLATRVFDLLRPWGMPPELLATVAVVAAAVPTAYTGASGIFVIAAGAVVYQELRLAGARRQLALAATAMSGSMGVVLRPCLLVVVIAMLNREVTTEQLFSWGALVLALTALVFLLVTMTLNRQSRWQLAPVSEALPATMASLRALLPYGLVIAGVVLFYRSVLGVAMDEFSAPRLLPLILIAVLVYEAVRFSPGSSHGKGRRQTEPGHPGLEYRLRHATSDTTAEIGALLLLFGLSISLGGVVERAGVMEHFPQAFDNHWAAMGLMVAVLVVLGMIMDAFGAIILVSATVATMAYNSGIHPVHFWMVTLVAFELGYLTPPVSLNHLLTRQVVGDEEVRLSHLSSGTFYQRHERLVMPMLVMGLSLLLVAFVPLLFYGL